MSVDDDEPFGHVPDGADPTDDPVDVPLDGSADQDDWDDDWDGDGDGDPELSDGWESEDPYDDRIPHRYRRSMGASALAAGMIGLRDLLELPKDDRPVVEQFVGEDDRPRAIEVELDPDDPAASVVRLRQLDD